MNRELDIQDLLDNVRTKFSDCNSITYSFVLYDRNGNLVNSFQNTSTTTDKDEKAKAILDTLETYLTKHDEVARVSADYGGKRPSQRTNTDYFIRSNDDESKEQLRQQLDEANGKMEAIEQEKKALSQRINEVKEANASQDRKSVMDTDYTQMTKDTITLLAQVAGVNTQGLYGEHGTITGAGLGAILQAQERRIKEDLKREADEARMNDLQLEIKALKKQIEDMRTEYERMEDENEELREWKREAEPLLKEAEKLKTKSGMISAGLGQAFGNMLAGFASKTKFAPLLGMLDDEDEEQPSAPQQYATQEQPVRVARVQEYDED